MIESASVPLEHALALAAVLFCTGLAGLMVRRNFLFMLMCLEIMTNAVALANAPDGSPHTGVHQQLLDHPFEGRIGYDRFTVFLGQEDPHRGHAGPSTHGVTNEGLEQRRPRGQLAPPGFIHGQQQAREAEEVTDVKQGAVDAGHVDPTPSRAPESVVVLRALVHPDAVELDSSVTGDRDLGPTGAKAVETPQHGC